MNSHSQGQHMTLRYLSQASFALAIITTPLASHAQYQATAYVPNGSVIGQTNTPGDITYSYSAGPFSANVSFTSDPIASVTYAASTAANPATNQYSGGGIMTYAFAVAAAPFTNVPIDFFGLYSSSQGSAGQQASSSFTIQTVNSSVYTYSTFASYFSGNCAAPTCLQYTTFNNTTYTTAQSNAENVSGSFQGTLQMLTGASGTVTGSVQLFAGANVASGLSSTNATVFIDPYLQISPAFLSANPTATLSITPGVGNAVSAVPEANTLLMMLSGLLAVSAVYRRRG